VVVFRFVAGRFLLTPRDAAFFFLAVVVLDAEVLVLEAEVLVLEAEVLVLDVAFFRAVGFFRAVSFFFTGAFLAVGLRLVTAFFLAGGFFLAVPVLGFAAEGFFLDDVVLAARTAFAFFFAFLSFFSAFAVIFSYFFRRFLSFSIAAFCSLACFLRAFLPDLFLRFFPIRLSSLIPRNRTTFSHYGDRGIYFFSWSGFVYVLSMFWIDFEAWISLSQVKLDRVKRF